uniref:Uncharacterized protein n=1 Tax=Arundo donax TaxID=35708 RepID=A0A0A9CNV3_ARUDO
MSSSVPFQKDKSQAPPFLQRGLDQHARIQELYIWSVVLSQHGKPQNKSICGGRGMRRRSGPAPRRRGRRRPPRTAASSRASAAAPGGAPPPPRRPSPAPTCSIPPLGLTDLGSGFGPLRWCGRREIAACVAAPEV